MEGFEVTEEMQLLISHLQERSKWTDGYIDSHADYIDRISYFMNEEEKSDYKIGSRSLYNIMKDLHENHRFWRELDLNSDLKDNYLECLEHIEIIMELL